MTLNDIMITLENYLEDECGIAKHEITQTTSLFLSGLLDSIDVLKLIQYIEKTFNIKINPFEVSLEKLDSIQQQATFIKEKISC